MSEHRASLRIGVLAIQGAFFEHRAALLKAAKSSTFSKSIDVEVLDVREAHQLSDLDGLILPGGESTTMSLFLQSSNFEDVLKDWVASKEKPRVVWGTCAGLILLSNDIEGQKEGGQSKVDISNQWLQCTCRGSLYSVKCGAFYRVNRGRSCSGHGLQLLGYSPLFHLDLFP